MDDGSKAINQCFLFKDNSKVFDCLKETVTRNDFTCKPKLVLLTQDGCPNCRHEEDHLKTDIESGFIQNINVDTVDGKDIVKRNGVEAVPALLILDCNNRMIEE